MKTVEIKNWILGIIPILLAGINETSVVVLTVFIFLDVVTGIISAIRIGGWHKLSSRTMSFGIVFKMLLLLIPFLLVWTGEGIGVDMMKLAVWSMNLLIISEALSILGNIQEIKSGVETKEIDAVNLMFKKIRSIFLQILER